MTMEDEGKAATRILNDLQRDLASADSYAGTPSGAFENLVRGTVKRWDNERPKPKPRTVAEAINDCSVYLHNCGKASPRTCKECGLGPCKFGLKHDA
jgi:hypothetical protein